MVVGIEWPGDEGVVSYMPLVTSITTFSFFFPEDEEHDLESGAPISGFLTALEAGGTAGRTVNVIAHSLGNVAVNSAISLAPAYTVNKYIMYDAALPAEALGSGFSSDPNLLLHAQALGYPSSTSATDARWIQVSAAGIVVVSLPGAIFGILWFFAVVPALTNNQSMVARAPKGTDWDDNDVEWNGGGSVWQNSVCRGHNHGANLSYKAECIDANEVNVRGLCSPCHHRHDMDCYRAVQAWLGQSDFSFADRLPQLFFSSVLQAFASLHTSMQ